MPIAGGFRSIDFVLSNMSNSHIQKVAVFTQYNAKSLNEHLNSSKWWDFGRKQGGLYVFTPTTTPENSYWYRGTLDAMEMCIRDRCCNIDHAFTRGNHIIDDDNIFALQVRAEELVGNDRIASVNNAAVIATFIEHTHIDAKNVCVIYSTCLLYTSRCV